MPANPRSAVKKRDRAPNEPVEHEQKADDSATDEVATGAEPEDAAPDESVDETDESSTETVATTGSAEAVEITESAEPSVRQLKRQAKREAKVEAKQDAALLEPRQAKGRRVVRVVRRVQLWSVFKVAVLSFLVFYGIALLGVAALWSLANSTGQVHHIEKFMRDIGFDNWTFDGSRLFSATAFGGAVLVVAASVFATLSGALLNIISELTGGIRFVVIESPLAAWSEDDTDD